MANNDIPRMVADLLTAPAEGLVEAASKQRSIWIKWLTDIKRILDSVDQNDDALKKKIIKSHLELAPIWKLSAQLSLGMTMRIASINRKETSASLGLAVGLLTFGGSFGFMSESSSESVIQIRAQYALSNEKEVKLTEYLDSLGVTLGEATDVTTAIEKLGVAKTPIKD